MSIRQIGQLDTVDTISATDKLIVQKQNMAHAIPTSSALELLSAVELTGLNTQANTLGGAINELYQNAKGVQNVIICTQAEYDSYDINPNTVYIIRLGTGIIARVYFGYRKVFPEDSNYDYIVENLVFNSTPEIATTIVPFSAANIDRDWMIEYDLGEATSTGPYKGVAIYSSYSTDATAIGFCVCQRIHDSTSRNGVYLDRISGYDAANVQVATPSRARIYKQGTTYFVYDMEENLLGSTVVQRTVSDSPIRLGGDYTNRDGLYYNGFAGTINKFGFKWL